MIVEGHRIGGFAINGIGRFWCIGPGEKFWYCNRISKNRKIRGRLIPTFHIQFASKTLPYDTILRLTDWIKDIQRMYVILYDLCHSTKVRKSRLHPFGNVAPYLHMMHCGLVSFPWRKKGNVTILEAFVFTYLPKKCKRRNMRIMAVWTNLLYWTDKQNIYRGSR